MLNFILFCVAVLAVVVACFWFRARNHGLWRKFLYKTHLWLGIASGIVLFIVCLTGTLLLFRTVITNFFEHDKYFVSHPDMSPLKLEDLITKVEQNMNGNVYVVRQYNNRKDTAYVMHVKTENNNKNTGVKVREDHIIDPYTGESLARRQELLGGEFWHIVSRLHTSLCLPRTFGRIIVGSATLIFVIIALTGSCLWLPANFRNKKAWANGFLVRFHKGKNSLIHDFHKTLGFYVLIPMLLMALTGLMLSFGWFRDGVNKIFNVQHSNVSIKSLIPANPDVKPLPLAYFIKKADELMENKDFRITIMRDKKDDTVFAVGRNNKAFKLIKGEYIDFDRYTGEVLKHERFEHHHIGKKIAELYPFIHYGNFFGLPTQIIYFTACLIATTLPITGVVIWWRKLRNLRKIKNKTE